jgi:predicted acyltransferase
VFDYRLELNAWFPINKSSDEFYVFFTAGLALQFLALCYWLIDIKGYVGLNRS